MSVVHITSSQLEEFRQRLLKYDELFKSAGIVDFRLECGEDSDGQQAVWAYLIITDDKESKFTERMKVRSHIREEIDYPMYSRFRRASEELTA